MRIPSFAMALVVIAACAFAGSQPARRPAPNALPEGVAVDSKGCVYVADLMYQRILKYDHNGKLLTTWGKPGEADGEFDFQVNELAMQTIGIAIDSSDNVYVADTRNCRIQKFDATGKFLASWGKRGPRKGEMNEPMGIAVTRSDRVYVADTGNNRIDVFSTSGQFIEWWPNSVADPKFQFGDTLSIACDPANNVYRFNYEKGMVQKFDAGKKLLKEWSIRRKGDNPTSIGGIALDKSGNVFISDINNDGAIRKFDRNGKFIAEWNIEGMPVSLATDAAGNVYIADSYGGCVRKLPPGGKLGVFAMVAKPIKTKPAKLPLAGKGMITGRVLPAGTDTLIQVFPVTNETGLREPAATAHPDAGGLFKLTLPPGKYDVSIYAPGYVPSPSEHIEVTANESHALKDITLVRAGSISGRILGCSPDDTSVVTAFPMLASGAYGEEAMEAPVSAKTGEFTIPSLAPGVYGLAVTSLKRGVFVFVPKVGESVPLDSPLVKQLTARLEALGKAEVTLNVEDRLSFYSEDYQSKDDDITSMRQTFEEYKTSENRQRHPSDTTVYTITSCAGDGKRAVTITHKVDTNHDPKTGKAIPAYDTDQSTVVFFWQLENGVWKIIGVDETCGMVYSELTEKLPKERDACHPVTEISADATSIKATAGKITGGINCRFR